MQLWIMLVPRIVVMTVAIIWSNFLIVDHFIIEVILKIFVLFCRAKALRCNVLFSGAEKRTKRDIHLSQALPYMEGM